jgi:hypothetical protein
MKFERGMVGVVLSSVSRPSFVESHTSSFNITIYLHVSVYLLLLTKVPETETSKFVNKVCYAKLNNSIIFNCLGCFYVI